MDYNKLAELLFPDIDCDIDFYEAKYPRRNLPEGARVTRLGPSPTGFIHLGNLYGALVDERLAHQSGGVFFLRIEDTDNKREVEGAVDIIINSLKYFNVHFDEGATTDGEKGAYGPYRQRQRREIYRSFAKNLTKKGLCYPCFCSEEENEKRRNAQEAVKANPGYYGEWATCRNLSYEEIEKRVSAGESYVMRFRAPEGSTRIIEVEDEIRGTLKMPENEMNFVVLKSDGIPTYHFAHLV
ncbi:MAG: glutamate--tRNA ligase, partial [Clostridia bacterium]|nr:glutamate--tRNA ligase [Clostridia bacterium]